MATCVRDGVRPTRASDGVFECKSPDRLGLSATIGSQGRSGRGSRVLVALFQPAARRQEGQSRHKGSEHRCSVVHSSGDALTHPALDGWSAATRIGVSEPSVPRLEIDLWHELMNIRIFITPWDRYDGHPSTDHLIRID
jgi:hypothetical protein